MKTHMNDLLIGNGHILAAFQENGNLIRCWWPHVDFGQHVDELRVGIALNSKENMTWLADTKSEKSAYLPRSNVVQFAYKHAGVRVVETSFAAISRNVLVRHFDGGGDETDGEDNLVFWGLDARLPIYEQGKYQTVRFEAEEGAVVHYFQDVYIAIGASVRPARYDVGRTSDHWSAEDLEGTNIKMCSDSRLVWKLKPTQPLTIFFAFGHSLDEALGELRSARDDGYEQLLLQSYADALSLLNRAKPWPTQLEGMLCDAGLAADDWIAAKATYERSLLVFHLLQDSSGAMIAAPELDESFSQCGGYAFCWGRDAAYIVTAFEVAGLSMEARNFYEWALKSQDKSGVWEHRHYTNGRLAPAWGIQLDETASLVWGIAKHLQTHRDEEFLKRALPAIIIAGNYLVSRMDSETGLPVASVDLWEERRGQHIYTAAAVSAALNELANVLQNGTLKIENEAQTYLAVAATIKSAIGDSYDEHSGAFMRGRQLEISAECAREMQLTSLPGVSETCDEYGYYRYTKDVDKIVDVSLLGLSIPFDVVPADDARMLSTANEVAKRLTRETGGIGRYEGDTYMGGNPWILATLWLAMYELKVNKIGKAMDGFVWALRHRTINDFLPEQIDRHSGDAAWVIPLAWSHAMYVLFIQQLHGSLLPAKSER